MIVLDNSTEPSTVRPISIDFTSSLSEDLRNDWKTGLALAPSVEQEDATEFFESILTKWNAYRLYDRIAYSLPEMEERIRVEEKAEVLGVLTASARWYRNGAVIGLCAFRRTWCHNLVFDFLCVHPELISQRRITGVGTALLYHLATLAKHLQAKLAWAETTDLSVEYYAKFFPCDGSDLIRMETSVFHKRLSDYLAKKIASLP